MTREHRPELPRWAESDRGELDGHPDLQDIARQVGELPYPAARGEQVARALSALDEAVQKRKAKNGSVPRLAGSRPFARMAAAVVGVSCLVAATVGGAYATGTRLPENASVGPLSALSSSSASESESGQTIILHQENVQTVTNGTASDEGPVTVPLRLHHGVIVTVDEHGVTVEGENGSTIIVVQSHSRVVVNGKEVDIDELKAGSTVRIFSGVPAPDDMSDIIGDILKSIRARLSKTTTDGSPNIRISGDAQPHIEIEGRHNHIQIEDGTVKIEAGGVSIEAGPRGVEMRGPGGSSVKVEDERVIIESRSQGAIESSPPQAKPQSPGKPPVPRDSGQAEPKEPARIPKPQAIEAPLDLPDADELIEEAMSQADANERIENATRQAKAAMGDLPKVPAMPRR